MKAKIDIYGTFYIYRSNKFKPQCCPRHYYERQCGDWCPKFGEPHNATILDEGDAEAINICGDYQLYDKIIDERKKN